MSQTHLANEEGRKFDLNLHMARLLMDEPFFAAISRRVDKRENNGIPTAGVRVNPETAQYEMIYNSEFFARLTDEQRQDVLKHEFYHIVFHHVTDRLPYVDGDRKMTKRWNIATDLAINSHLHHLPEGCCKPGIPDTPFADMPSGMSAEWYMQNLPKPESKPEPGKGEGSGGEGSGGEGSQEDIENWDSFDNHEGWGEVSEDVKEIAKERLKDIVRKAAEDCAKSNSWGSVSGSVREEIISRTRSVIDWRKVLRYFIKTSRRAERKSSIRRINKRYPYVHPGKKTDRRANIAVSIDQSGSVSNSMLAAFFAELNTLASLAQFTVVPFDTRVDEDKVFVWKKGETRKVERVLTGGTNFDAPTEWVNSRSFDGHIVLTDLCAPKPVKSQPQRMWITTEYYSKRPYFSTNERIVAIPDRDM